MKIELKRRTPEEVTAYMVAKIVELQSDNKNLRAHLAELLKWYMHPNPPHEMLSEAKAALEEGTSK